MVFQVTDQPLFAVASFWQCTAKGNGVSMVICDVNALIAPIHSKAMITVREPSDHEPGLRAAATT